MITVITHAFKAGRVLDLHCKALKWPRARIQVRGIDPPDSFPGPPDGDSDAVKGQQRRKVWEEGENQACSDWERDLYGVNEEGLCAKRRKRGWVGDGAVEVWDGEEDGNGVRALIRWRGGEDGKQVFPGRLPWEEDEEGEAR
jgi:hypothetical protein